MKPKERYGKLFEDKKLIEDQLNGIITRKPKPVGGSRKRRVLKKSHPWKKHGYQAIFVPDFTTNPINA